MDIIIPVKIVTVKEIIIKLIGTNRYITNYENDAVYYAQRDFMRDIFKAWGYIIEGNSNAYFSEWDSKTENFFLNFYINLIEVKGLKNKELFLKTSQGFYTQYSNTYIVVTDFFKRFYQLRITSEQFQKLPITPPKIFFDMLQQQSSSNIQVYNDFFSMLKNNFPAILKRISSSDVYYEKSLENLTGCLKYKQNRQDIINYLQGLFLENKIKAIGEWQGEETKIKISNWEEIEKLFASQAEEKQLTEEEIIEQWEAKINEIKFTKHDSKEISKNLAVILSCGLEVFTAKKNNPKITKQQIIENLKDKYDKDKRTIERYLQQIEKLETELNLPPISQYIRQK